MEKVRARLSARTKVGRALGKVAVFLLSYALLVSVSAAAHGPIAAHLIAAFDGEHVVPLRLSSAPAQSSQSETWFGRQGEIPEKAGAMVAACAAYEQAIATIDALPERHRETEATPDLEACLKGPLLRLRR